MEGSVAKKFCGGNIQRVNTGRFLSEAAWQEHHRVGAGVVWMSGGGACAALVPLSALQKTYPCKELNEQIREVGHHASVQ